MRKSVFILFFLLCVGQSFSQEYSIPQIEWHGKDQTENQYIDLLKLKDKNAVIVKIGYSSYWIKGQVSELIVYQNDGTVKRFLVDQPNSADQKTKVKRKRIKKKHYPHYWKHLQDCIAQGKLKIDKSRLNIDEKEGPQKGSVVYGKVSDGTTFSFWIYQGCHYIAFGSYAPTAFIEDKYPGYEERQKLVDLMYGFEELTRKY
jgi:hypothetical protein